MLPVYPLDGGQIFRSLLWFVLGRANSLLVASLVGFIGVAGLIAFAIWQQSKWLGVMSVFVAFNCWSGFKQARALARVAKLPRRVGFACPSCKTAPPTGAFWRCGKCGTTFDMFLTQAVCPNCQSHYNAILCLDCGTASSLGAWMTVPPSHN
jgi:DNA-directed RNA polymerase subunit RPC12/RpoP